MSEMIKTAGIDVSKATEDHHDGRPNLGGRLLHHQRGHDLGRDYRRVHDDVAALHEAGLLEKGEEGLRADYDAFDVRMQVAL